MRTTCLCYIADNLSNTFVMKANYAYDMRPIQTCLYLPSSISIRSQRVSYWLETNNAHNFSQKAAFGPQTQLWENTSNTRCMEN